MSTDLQNIFYQKQAQSACIWILNKPTDFDEIPVNGVVGSSPRLLGRVNYSTAQKLMIIQYVSPNRLYH